MYERVATSCWNTLVQATHIGRLQQAAFPRAAAAELLRCRGGRTCHPPLVAQPSSSSSPAPPNTDNGSSGGSGWRTPPHRTAAAEASVVRDQSERLNLAQLQGHGSTSARSCQSPVAAIMAGGGVGGETSEAASAGARAN